MFVELAEEIIHEDDIANKVQPRKIYTAKFTFRHKTGAEFLESIDNLVAKKASHFKNEWKQKIIQRLENMLSIKKYSQYFKSTKNNNYVPSKINKKLKAVKNFVQKGTTYISKEINPYLTNLKKSVNLRLNENYHFITPSIEMQKYIKDTEKVSALKTLFCLELFCLEKFHTLLPEKYLQVPDDVRKPKHTEVTIDMYNNPFFEIFKAATIEISRNQSIQ